MARAMKSNQSAVAGGVSTTGGGNAGLGRSGLGSAGGQRLPTAPRERKPALAALAVLLILGGALTSAYLVMASGQRVSAIRVVQPVAAGQQIPPNALQEVQIGDTGIEYIRWSARGDVTRTYAAVPLVPGALLTNAMVSRANDASKGRVVIGLALKPGQYPAKGLTTGKHVGLYAVGGTGTTNSGGPRPGTVLSADAIVIGVSGGGNSDRLRGDQTSVDVAVLPAEAPQLTQAASAGGVALALVPEGTRLTGAPQAPEKQSGSPEPGNGTGNQNGTGTGNNNPGPGAGTPNTGGN
ncbi:hypothetical protein J4573_33565 [Actinomadura barringtoniae]|uniref:SAF domain-containing protein n=1 Tax=Actinomadura barringtoniae TaxID=1427535 RepID=A0A939PGX4_9ACTN|nr:hypothetical protein [Actinomadura barringtoniae]MBO2452057.1 hypothetical protein [Actinomadura barringtoniae]